MSTTERLPFDVLTVSSKNAYSRMLTVWHSVAEGLIEIDDVEPALMTIQNDYFLTPDELIAMSACSRQDVTDLQADPLTKVN